MSHVLHGLWEFCKATLTSAWHDVMLS